MIDDQFIFNKLSECIDIYSEAVDVFKLFLEAFGNNNNASPAFHGLGTFNGYEWSVNGLIRYEKNTVLFEEFLQIKAHKIGEFNHAIKTALRDSHGFLHLIKMYSESKNREENFVNAFKEPKTVSGVLFGNLNDLVNDPDTSMGHNPVPKLYSFNVDIESVAKSMLALISKLTEKDLNLTDKGSNLTIGEKLTPELKSRLTNLNNNYFLPAYKGDKIELSVTQEDFKNLQFREEFLKQGMIIKEKIDQFQKDFDKVYYGRR